MLIQKLDRIRRELADEIDQASRREATRLMAALVKARDALNEASAAAGDKSAMRHAERHASLEEMGSHGQAD